MKAVNRFFMGITLAIALLGVGVAWGDSSVVGGNAIVDRPELDTFSNFYLVDTNHPLNADGRLDQWEIYAGSTSPVQLVIYRQKGGAFFVVGRSGVKTPERGYNLFKLSPGNKIKVKAGDFVGAYFPATGSISFNFDPSDSFNNFDDLSGATLYSKPNGAPIEFIGSSNRHYSIRVMGKQRPREKSCQINIASANAQPNVLWPPNNKMVPVTVTVSVSSDCKAKPACEILSVTSNEDITGDWQITGYLTAKLRAERTGSGSGRVYTLSGECADTEGNNDSWDTTVTVPHNR